MTHLHTTPRHELKGRAAIERLADDMIVQTGSYGGATRAELVAKGWDQKQLDKHGDAAREAARARETFN